MRKVWAVVRREFLERVRAKWFIITTVLGPVFMLAITVLPVLLSSQGGGGRIAVVDDGSGGFGPRLVGQLATGNRFTATLVPSDSARGAALRDSLTRAVQAKTLDGFLVVGPTTLETGRAEYRGRNVSSLRDMEMIQSALRQAVTVERLTRHGIDPALVQEAQQRIHLDTKRITRRGATGETGEATFILAYIVGFVLYMAIFLYGQNVMRSVIEEKRTRTIEVLISSLKPFQLMLGKVIGVGAVGLLQFGIWAAAAGFLFAYRMSVMAALSVPANAAASMQFPAIGFGLIALVLAYFVIGYVLYSALFAVVGASVNTEAEAQQAMMPVTLLLVAAIILFPVVLQDPGGRLAMVMGVVPFFSPIIMPIRYAASDVPGSEIAVSLVVAALFTVFTVWLAGRIYRVGILMYGKRPNVPELIRWAREG